MTTIIENDFDVYASGTVNILNPGAGLHFDKSGTGGGQVNFPAKLAVIADQGVINGYISLAFTAALTSPSGSQIGIACLQSQRSLTAGTAYVMLYQEPTGLVSLYKNTAGLATATYLTSVSAPAGGISIGLAWLVSPDLDWTLLIASVDGTEQLRYQDFVSPYTSGVTESGFFWDTSDLAYEVTFVGVLMEGPP